MRIRHLLSAAFALLLALSFSACDYGRTVSDIDIYVQEFDFNVSTAQLNGTVLSQQYSVPAIDGDNGAVLVYFQEQGTWTAMPYTYAVDDPQQQAVSYTISLGYAFSNRSLEVFYESSAADVNLRSQPSRRLKMVVLGDLAYKQGVDHRDWNAVKAAYGLSD